MGMFRRGPYGKFRTRGESCLEKNDHVANIKAFKMEGQLGGDTWGCLDRKWIEVLKARGNGA